MGPNMQYAVHVISEFQQLLFYALGSITPDFVLYK